jgi:uroporphyrinogen-III synthase
MKLLILRARPAADETADRAVARGLDAVVAPLFTVHPVDWDAPDPAGIEAVLLTSANAARHAGAQIQAFLGLPCYAVGEASAAAARAGGFTDVRPGNGDGAAIVGRMDGDGIVRALHLCGRDHLAPEHGAVALTRRIVYAAEAAGTLPNQARQAIEEGSLALLHSPRAGRLLAVLTDAATISRDRVALAAISEAAAAAAGLGWRSKAIAHEPSDQALLELAVELCQTGGEEMGKFE